MTTPLRAAWCALSFVLALAWMAWIRFFGRPADPGKGWKR